MRTAKITMAWLLASLLCISFLTGCGGQSNTSGSDDAANTSNNSEAVSGTVDNTETDIKEEAEKSENTAVPSTASEDDFSIVELGDGTCEVTYCSSEASIIKVPGTIHGNTVVGMADYAFSNCDAEEIILPDTVEYIGGAVFVNCENLRSVDLGTGLKSIGQMAFNECPVLETLEFPEGMTTIANLVLGSCDVLEEVYIPASVTEIGEVITYTNICPNIVIVTPAGSAAEAVALANELPVQNP